MSDHDPICRERIGEAGYYCTCTEIAEARADEREWIAQAIEALEVRLPWGPAGSQMVSRTQVLRLLHPAARIARNEDSDG